MSIHFIQVPVNLQQLSLEAARRHSRDPLLENELHHQITETLGRGILQPFSLSRNGDGHTARLQGYADRESSEVVKLSRMFADPARTGIDWEGVASKEMPGFQKGQVLGFDVTVVPTRRGERGKRELDAYLSDRARAEREATMLPDRDTSYSRWLSERLDPVARIVSETFRVHEVSERRMRRGRNVMTLPEATFRGVLVVEDPIAFSDRLASGIGRHRAYGYGMMKLTPASGRRC